MTPQEKLKEIKSRRNTEYDSDIKWLIARVEQLENFMKEIRSKYPCSNCSYSEELMADSPIDIILNTGPKPE